MKRKFHPKWTKLFFSDLQIQYYTIIRFRIDAEFNALFFVTQICILYVTARKCGLRVIAKVIRYSYSSAHHGYCIMSPDCIPKIRIA